VNIAAVKPTFDTRSPHGYRYWNVVWFLAAIVAIAFLPDRRTSHITVSHIVAVIVIGIGTLSLMTGESMPHPNLASRTLRWYSLVALTIIAFVIGVRIRFPIESDYFGHNNTVQRCVRDIVSIPLAALCIAAIIFPICSRTARRSLSFWLIACLTIAVLTSMPGWAAFLRRLPFPWRVLF
jgi:hypothetical protein